MTLLLLAACSKDSMGPADLADPVALQAELSAAEGAFDSEAFASFGAVTSYLGPTPAAPAVPLIRASLSTLPQPGNALFAAAAARGEQLRQFGPQLSSIAAQGPVVDASLYGRVYRWDPTTDLYVWDGEETVGGVNGVRFILYAVDELGVIVEPVVEVGSVDLIDESNFTGVRLRILVRGNGGATTYVNYLAAVSPTSGSVALEVSGTVSNGLSGSENKTVTFSLGIAASSTAVTLEASFSLNNPAITIELRESVSVTDSSAAVEIEFRVAREGELVRVLMRVEAGDQTSVTVEVRVNGGRVARLSGNVTTAEWVDAGGDPLGVDDLQALDSLLTSVARFEVATLSLFEPVADLF
jgi:hypothetical protein